jgi:2-dehydro-3-deoxygluconokinase
VTAGGVDLVTLGETMALLWSTEVGLLRHAAQLRLSTAGAESNVAVGVRRLGRTAAWVGRVGADEFGELVLAQLRAQRVDVSAAVVDDERPTGLMIKSRRTSDVTRVVYYRSGSAGSRLAPGDVPEQLVAGCRVLHVTGITPALSASARDAVFAAVDIARAAGVCVSLDVNYRAKLWSPDDAATALRPLAARVDVLFASEDEAQLLTGEADLAALPAALARLGPPQAVVKRGERGAGAVIDDRPFDVPAVPVSAIDSVGAGDAFVAGYLAGLVAGHPPEERLRTGAAAGAFAVTVAGDWEGLPHADELALLDEAAGTVRR